MEKKTDSELTARIPLGERIILSKGDARYWSQPGRLFKNHGAPDYACRFTALGRREHFNLGSANKKQAAAKAAEIFRLIQAHGWDEALTKYKPSAKQRSIVTVGCVIAAAGGLATVRPQTFEAYAKAFRRIVSESRNINAVGKYCSRGSEAAKWRAKVDAVPLHLITPTAVNSWKLGRLRASGADALAKRRAVVTVNSLLRNAASLFGRKLLPQIETTATSQK